MRRLRAPSVTEGMCHFRLDKRAVERRFGLADFDATFAEARGRLAALEADGLVTLGPDTLGPGTLEPGTIEVSSPGRFLIRNVACAFDAYLRQPKRAATYSRSA